jgi:hypothetical protein
MLTKARDLLTGCVDVHKLGEALVVVHRRLHRLEAATVWSVDVLDDLDEFVGAVAVLAGVVDEVACFLEDGPPFGGTGDGDAAAAAEFEESFVAEQPQGPQHGVGLTSRMAARSLAGGRRSPGLASPLAMARRISAATCW